MPRRPGCSRVPRRARRGPDRVDGEDGRGHQHPGPVRSRSTTSTAPGGPADIEQRDGRGVRQGNQNPEIHILRYAVEGVVRRLQLADRRAQGPVHQPDHARPARRPRDRGHRREHAQLRRSQSARLGRPARSSTRPASTPRSPAWPAWSAPGSETGAPYAERSPPRTTAPPCSRRRHAGRHRRARAAPSDPRRAVRYDDRRAAGDRARASRAGCSARSLAPIIPGPPHPAGELGGLAVDAQLASDPATGTLRVEFSLHGLPTRPATLSRAELPDGAMSLIRQLEHRLDSLDAARRRATPAPRRPSARGWKRPVVAADARRRRRRCACICRWPGRSPAASASRSRPRTCVCRAMSPGRRRRSPTPTTATSCACPTGARSPGKRDYALLRVLG